MKHPNVLLSFVHKAIDEYPENQPVSAYIIAQQVENQLDPNKEAPYHVSLSSTLHLEAVARPILAKQHGPDISDINLQAEMFSSKSLQKSYSVKRNGKAIYVPRMQLTVDERRKTSHRLTKMGKTFMEHGDMLDKETSRLIESGHFLETTGENQQYAT